MIEMTDSGKKRLKEIFEFAVDNDCVSEIVDQLQYLNSYGSEAAPKSKVVFTHDFAPLSMTFMMYGHEKGKWTEWFNGGLLYSGPGVKLDGGAPSFSMSLNKEAREGLLHRWSTHT